MSDRDRSIWDRQAAKWNAHAQLHAIVASCSHAMREGNLNNLLADLQNIIKEVDKKEEEENVWKKAKKSLSNFLPSRRMRKNKKGG